MRYASLVLLLGSPILSSATRTSRDATCGGKKGYTCLGSIWGDCCSQYGWCGSTPAYCAAGCQPAYGSCRKGASTSKKSSSARPLPAATTLKSSPCTTLTTSTRSPSSPASTASQLVSNNARCGPHFGGRTCQGSQWGNCCPQYSYCESSKAYCDAKTCQKGFGLCNGEAVSSLRVSSSSSRVSSSVVSPPGQVASSISLISSSIGSTSSVSSGATSSALSDTSATKTSATISTAASLSTPHTSSELQSQSPTPSPDPVGPSPTCGVRGFTLQGPFYITTPYISRGRCRSFCENGFQNRPCRVYALDEITRTCLFTSGPPPSSQAATFEQVVRPIPGSQFTFFDLSCDDGTTTSSPSSALSSPIETPLSSPLAEILSSSSAIGISPISSTIEVSPPSSPAASSPPIQSPSPSSSPIETPPPISSSEVSIPRSASPTPSNTPTPSPTIPEIPSSSAPAPPRPTCTVRGRASSRVGYYPFIPGIDIAECRQRCLDWNNSSYYRCGTYGVPVYGLGCSFSLGVDVPEPWDRAIVEDPEGDLLFSDVSCPVPTVV